MASSYVFPDSCPNIIERHHHNTIPFPKYLSCKSLRRVSLSTWPAFWGNELMYSYSDVWLYCVLYRYRKLVMQTFSWWMHVILRRSLRDLQEPILRPTRTQGVLQWCPFSVASEDLFRVYCQIVYSYSNVWQYRCRKLVMLTSFYGDLCERFVTYARTQMEPILWRTRAQGVRHWCPFSSIFWGIVSCLLPNNVSTLAVANNYFHVKTNITTFWDLGWRGETLPFCHH